VIPIAIIASLERTARSCNSTSRGDVVHNPRGRTIETVRQAIIVAMAITCAAAGTFTADAIQLATDAHSIRQGDVVVVTATTSQPVDAMRARAFNRDLATFRLDDTRWQALLGIDIDTKPGVYTVSFEAMSAGNTMTAATKLTVMPREFGRRVLRVDDSYVNPPEPVIARIMREAAELEQIWTQSEPQRLWTNGFFRPVPGRVNGAFGSRSVFNGQPRQPHGGADFLSPAGTPIRAPNSGRVVLARDLYFTGNTVVIDHGLGVFSLLAHLSVVDVHQGEFVSGGETIGQVGSSGRVTGPHLHWAVRMNGARVDPMVVLDTIGQDAAISERPTAR
jgi:murein DD-endopeptidase MepM/ murein hydrolase activator NlpD